jgi:hypothetical protein
VATKPTQGTTKLTQGTTKPTQGQPSQHKGHQANPGDHQADTRRTKPTQGAPNQHTGHQANSLELNWFIHGRVVCGLPVIHFTKPFVVFQLNRFIRTQNKNGITMHTPSLPPLILSFASLGSNGFSHSSI